MKWTQPNKIKSIVVVSSSSLQPIWNNTIQNCVFTMILLAWNISIPFVLFAIFPSRFVCSCDKLAILGGSSWAILRGSFNEYSMSDLRALSSLIELSSS